MRHKRDHTERSRVYNSCIHNWLGTQGWMCINKSSSLGLKKTNCEKFIQLHLQPNLFHVQCNEETAAWTTSQPIAAPELHLVTLSSLFGISTITDFYPSVCVHTQFSEADVLIQTKRSPLHFFNERHSVLCMGVARISHLGSESQAVVYVHTVFHWNHFDWRFRVSCLHGMW